MTADQLSEAIEDLNITAKPLDRLKEALALLKKAHAALDAAEGDLQDLKDDEPSKWERGILEVVNAWVFELADTMEVAKDHAANKYGYTSPEYETANALAVALDPSGKETY